jgi:hypothetical protein
MEYQNAPPHRRESVPAIKQVGEGVVKGAGKTAPPGKKYALPRRRCRGTAEKGSGGNPVTGPTTQDPRCTAPRRAKRALDIAAGGRIDWLPRETILFDRADLRRRFNVPMHGDAHLLAVEPVVFGRLAIGEHLRNSARRDSWRIRRGGAGDGVFYPGVATGRGAA